MASRHILVLRLLSNRVRDHDRRGSAAMIYNTGFKFGKLIEPPTQDEIYSCPEFYALTRREILLHQMCPPWLKRVIGQLPFDGRQNVIQVRPQDFRTQLPGYMGDHWHTDIMVMLEDGTSRCARDEKEFHLMSVSFGDVVETEFVANPVNLPSIINGPNEFGPPDLTSYFNRFPMETLTPDTNQLVEYTSLDVHRMGRNPKIGRLRLIIIAFDCDQVPGGGKVIPSLRDRK